MSIEKVEFCRSAVPLNRTSYWKRAPVRIFTSIRLSGESRLKLAWAEAIPARPNRGSRMRAVCFQKDFIGRSPRGENWICALRLGHHASWARDHSGAHASEEENVTAICPNCVSGRCLHPGPITTDVRVGFLCVLC